MTTEKSPFVSSEIPIGLLNVTLLRREDGKNVNRLVSKIQFGHRVVFRFTAENYEGRVAVMFCELEGRSYALTLHGHDLLDVYDIAAMTSWQMVGVEEGRPVFEGRDVKEAIQLRFRIAASFKLKPVFTKSEQAIVNWLEKKKNEDQRRAEEEARAAFQKEREAEHAARQEKRREKMSLMLRRSIVHGYTSDGRRLPGAVPVITGSDDWLALRHDTCCVEVEWYDDETQTHGAFGKFFRVSKNGHARKTQICEFFTNPEKRSGIELIGSCTLVVADEPIVVNLYSKESLTVLLETGLNSGKLVGVPLDDSRVQIYKFSKGAFNTFGAPIERIS